jgi:hypothetical protein
MGNKLRLRDFIALGYHAAIVANPRPWKVDVVTSAAADMLVNMKGCQLQRALDSAFHLGNKAFLFDRRTGRMTDQACDDLERTMTAVNKLTYEEADEREVLILDPSIVSPRLKKTANAEWLTDAQKRLADETILCLEREAFRAAVVMAWSFAYDVVRYWVFSDPTRLTAFNAELAKCVKRNSGNRTFDDIVEYDDFYKSSSPGESKVIEICEDAGLIGGKVARKLVHYLDTRNDYAHATPAYPTAPQATAYIDHLLDALEDQPFKLDR